MARGKKKTRWSLRYILNIIYYYVLDINLIKILFKQKIIISQTQ